jgi:hypothetical protein
MTQARTTSASRKTTLRPIGMPRQVMVRIDMRHPDALPLAVTRTDARGKRGAEARVEIVDEVWRIAEAWWRGGAAGAPGGQARTYYRVILEGGRPLTIFRDEAHGGWFEQPYSAGQARHT